jgi:hypothetical protein
MATPWLDADLAGVSQQCVTGLNTTKTDAGSRQILLSALALRLRGE